MILRFLFWRFFWHIRNIVLVLKDSLGIL